MLLNVSGLYRTQQMETGNQLHRVLKMKIYDLFGIDLNVGHDWNAEILYARFLLLG